MGGADAVEDDEHFSDLVDEDDPDQSEHAEEGQREEGDDDRQCESDVRGHDASAAAYVGEGGGYESHVVVGEGHVSGRAKGTLVPRRHSVDRILIVSRA